MGMRLMTSAKNIPLLFATIGVVGACCCCVAGIVNVMGVVADNIVIRLMAIFKQDRTTKNKPTVKQQKRSIDSCLRKIVNSIVIVVILMIVVVVVVVIVIVVIIVIVVVIIGVVIVVIVVVIIGVVIIAIVVVSHYCDCDCCLLLELFRAHVMSVNETTNKQTNS